MNENDITQFLVSFSGNIELIRFPAGVFDEQLYVQYDVTWGLDWDPISGLCSGVSQMARPGSDPERVVINMPVEMTFGSTNVYGWPQLIVTVRARNTLSGDCLRGYALFLLPPTTGTHDMSAPLVCPRSSTMLGEWLSWLTGRYPELVDPKMLASGKENYCTFRYLRQGALLLAATSVVQDYAPEETRNFLSLLCFVSVINDECHSL